MHPPNDGIIIAASILAADPLNLDKALNECQATNQVQWIHVDVMDGEFTPNLSFGPATVKEIAKKTTFSIDVHLMVNKPLNTIEAFAQSGAHSLSIHAEAKDDAAICLKTIRRLGCKAGIVLKPKTPFEAIKPLMALADLVLIMTVEPGYSGQKFIPECVAKVSEVKQWIQDNHLKCLLQVDGGIGASTIAPAIRAGADVLVCGSSLFRDGPLKTAPRLRQAIKEAL